MLNPLFSITWGQNNTKKARVSCTRIIFTVVVQVDSYTTSQIIIMQGRITFQAKHKIFDCGLLAMYWRYVGPGLPFHMNSEKLSTCKELFETWYSNVPPNINCFSYTWNALWPWFTLKRIKICNPNTDSKINHFTFKIADSSV